MMATSNGNLLLITKSANFSIYSPFQLLAFASGRNSCYTEERTASVGKVLVPSSFYILSIPISRCWRALVSSLATSSIEPRKVSISFWLLDEQESINNPELPGGQRGPAPALPCLLLPNGQPLLSWSACWLQGLCLTRSWYGYLCQQNRWVA